MWWKSSPSAGENHGFTVGFTTRWSNQRQPGGFDRARLLAAYLFFPILCIYPIYPSIYPRTYICTRIIHYVPFPSIYLSIYLYNIIYVYMYNILYIIHIILYTYNMCNIYIWSECSLVLFCFVVESPNVPKRWPAPQPIASPRRSHPMEMEVSTVKKQKNHGEIWRF